MNNHIQKKYSSLASIAWVALAVIVVLFCGPIRKLVDLDTFTSATTTQTSFKKAKETCKEKRDVPPSVFHMAARKSINDGLTPVLLTAVLSFLLFARKSNLYKSLFFPHFIAPGLPIYLHLGKIQV